jgi:antitoxin HicB
MHGFDTEQAVRFLTWMVGSCYYCGMKEITYTVHIEPATEGGYVAFFPALPGCHTQGETLEEVIAMAKDALSGYLACLRAHGDPIPEEQSAPKPIGFDLPLRMSLAR